MTYYIIGYKENGFINVNVRLTYNEPSLKLNVFNDYVKWCETTIGPIGDEWDIIDEPVYYVTNHFQFQFIQIGKSLKYDASEIITMLKIVFPNIVIVNKEGYDTLKANGFYKVNLWRI